MTPAIRSQLAGKSGGNFKKNVLSASLQPAMKRAVQPYYSSWKIVKATAFGEWDIEYNPISGRPVSRTIDGQVFLKSADDGKSCAWNGVSYKERYLGAGKWSTEMSGSASLDLPTPIACAALPK
jgi:hypothetical protein